MQPIVSRTSSVEMPMTYNQASLPDARASKPLGATDPGDRTLPLYGARWGQAISRFSVVMLASAAARLAASTGGSC